MILSLILFYASYTGEPYFRLIERNWGQTVVVEYAVHPEHNAYQVGDLSLDGVVNQADSEIYNSLMLVPFGWTLGGKVHWFKDCSYIAGKAVRAVEIKDNMCLRCKARMINDI